MGVLEAQFTAHTKADEIGFERINSDTTKIMATLEKISSKLDASVERIHVRIDETAANARHGLSNEAQVSRAGFKAAMDFSQEAHDRIGDEKADTLSRLGGLKVWVLTGVISGLVAILAIAVQIIRGAN